MRNPLDELMVPEHVAHERAVAEAAKPRAIVPCLIRRPWPARPQRIIVSKRLSPELTKAGIPHDTYATKPARHAFEILYHQMHVIPKEDAERPFCGMPTPEGFELALLSQEENAELMEFDRTIRWPWAKIVWCAACTDMARWLING